MLGRIRVKIVALEKAVRITFSVCVCSLLSSTQSACVVLYGHLWPVWLCHIFPRYLINGTIFEKKKKLLNINACFNYLYNSDRNISDSEKT
jgi:hypothetical protein